MVNNESHMLRTMAEKYRPSSEDDTIGHDRNIKILKNFLFKTNRFLTYYFMKRQKLVKLVQNHE